MYSNILIATDGSDLATKAVDHGLSLAKILEAEVTFVTVTEKPVYYVSDAWGYVGSPPMGETAELEAIHAKHAQLVLGEAAARAKSAAVSYHLAHVPDQHASDGIIEAAEEHKSDLIVMASHGRRGLRKLLMGSQASEVLARSHVPVLVVR